MLKLIQALAARIQSQDGQTFVEYALVIGGISLVLLTAFGGLGTAVEGLVTKITAKL